MYNDFDRKLMGSNFMNETIVTTSEKYLNAGIRPGELLVLYVAKA